MLVEEEVLVEAKPESDPVVDVAYVVAVPDEVDDGAAVDVAARVIGRIWDEDAPAIPALGDEATPAGGGVAVRCPGAEMPPPPPVS